MKTRKDDIAKKFNTESAIKNDKYRNGERMSVFLNLKKTFEMEIQLEHFGSNKEYYVLKRKYKNTDKWEIHLDKETGLVVKEINKEAEKRHYPHTNVVTQVNDRITTYKYEFDIVTDEDVTVPDMSDYTIETTRFNYEIPSE